MPDSASSNEGTFQTWMEEVGSPDWIWVIKRLAANDTLATGAHQAGPYIPKQLFFKLFPTVRRQTNNPDVCLPARMDNPDAPARDVRAVWYNEKTRDECRITRWGGIRSPILDPEATGSVCILAFHKQRNAGADADYCRVWLCGIGDEEVLFDRTGPIDPGGPLALIGGSVPVSGDQTPGSASCWLTVDQLPAEWLEAFPPAREIVAKAVSMRALPGKSTDHRLLERRDCEYALFRSLEDAVVLPRIAQGFESVDEFVAYGHSVANRRKSRSGWSLEYQVRGILDEERIPFSHGEKSEEQKRPDFLFPSADAYREARQPLAMLAAKTTCKDRWRQILNEADLIKEKHLLTVQEGLSLNQHHEMKSAGVRLVVPKALHARYPQSVRPELLSLDDFIKEMSAIAGAREHRKR